MVAPATALGVDILLFAEDANDSGAQVTHHVVGDYTNLEQVLVFARQCDVVTFEHELVPLSVIRGLEADGIKVYPSSRAFIYSQDKAEMRKKLAGFPAPEFAIISEPSSITKFPVIAKAISGGYDGRGVWKVETSQEIREILKMSSPLLIEELIEFDSEIAVMVARSPHGQATTWAPVETVQQDGICVLTITPAQKISSGVAERAQQMALEIANEVGVVGVMAVEMFIKGEEIFINELAMRPHNSGHWSIEGAVTSQFEQHLRAILDLPLGSPALSHEFSVMGNVLGGDKTDMYRPYLHLMARNPSLHFHQYRKDVRPGRKIGHVTACGDDLLHLIQEVEHARDYMSGVIDE